MNRWTKPKLVGFTIVELLIVIVVIGILASITVVAFNGIQNRTIETSAISTLTQAGKSIEVIKATDGSYPSVLPSSIQSSGKLTINLVPSTLPYYENIGAVQTGVLVSQICQDLINEGKGRSTNFGGGTENYVTGCG
ncbi:MAG: prepilin-type N-terminal cleavage/methylation domain-containing protein, partial [Alcaligenaceae bacterium]